MVRHKSSHEPECSEKQYVCPQIRRWIFRWLVVGVRDPRTGYVGPWVRVVDWAWTPEETSSRPRRRRRRRRRHRGGIPKSKSFVFRRMWTISGRRRRHFDRLDLARLFLLKKKTMFFFNFPVFLLKCSWSAFWHLFGLIFPSLHAFGAQLGTSWASFGRLLAPLGFHFFRSGRSLDGQGT